MRTTMSGHAEWDARAASRARQKISNACSVLTAPACRMGASTPNAFCPVDTIEYHRNALLAQGDDPLPVEQLVALIQAAPDEVTLKGLLAELEVEANKLGWPRDKDYAALLLQHAVLQVENRPARAAMLDFALAQATWCASCATAGGEGLARSAHVRELESMRRVA